MSGPVAGVVIANKYTVERPLGRGGMGSVWLARHRDLGTPVAIKFMEGVFVASADARARFEREAKAAAHLDSMHVVQVQDYGIDHGLPYIVMELLKGEDLAARLAREGRLSLPAVADIVNQVARALRKAHEIKLVHRDLKPANIFIAEKDDIEIVKVLDFGIAKAAGPGFAGPATQTGALIGTLHYMSPEQARRSKDVDHRSDLWAIGVIVYRAITGHLPFPGDEIGDVIVKICADPIPPATKVAPDLPKQVDVFMARALARKQEERFQSVGELASALSALAGIAVAGPSLTQTTPPVSAPVRPVVGVRPSVRAPETRRADAHPPSSTLPWGPPPKGVPPPVPSSTEEVSLSEAVSIRSHDGAAAEIQSSEEISLSDAISIRSHDAIAAETQSSEEISLSDVIVVDDKPSARPPTMEAPRPPTLEPPTQRIADPAPAPTVGDEGSLSPSLQTLYPERTKKRLLVTVAVAIAVTLGLLFWWTLGGETAPVAATQQEPSSTASMGTSASPGTSATSSISSSSASTASSDGPPPAASLSVTSESTGSAPSASPGGGPPPGAGPTSTRPREKRLVLP